jgi:hypothetical protein
VSGVGTAPRSKKEIERRAKGWKWCGPDDCGFPRKPCKLCDETCSELRASSPPDSDEPPVFMPRGRHAHGTGVSTQVYVPREHDPNCSCPPGAIRCAGI